MKYILRANHTCKVADTTLREPLVYNNRSQLLQLNTIRNQPLTGGERQHVQTQLVIC
jgi:hypothetical protein